MAGDAGWDTNSGATALAAHIDATMPPPDAPQPLASSASDADVAQNDTPSDAPTVSISNVVTSRSNLQQTIQDMLNEHNAAQTPRIRTRNSTAPRIRTV